MQRLDHLFELDDLRAWFGAGCVAAMRSEKGHRVVAPIVRSLHFIAVDIENRELVNWHQFHSRDAQRLEVRDLLDHAQVRARVF